MVLVQIKRLYEGVQKCFYFHTFFTCFCFFVCRQSCPLCGYQFHLICLQSSTDCRSDKGGFDICRFCILRENYPEPHHQYDDNLKPTNQIIRYLSKSIIKNGTLLPFAYQFTGGGKKKLSKRNFLRNGRDSKNKIFDRQKKTQNKKFC